MIANEPSNRQLRNLAKGWIAELSNVAEPRQEAKAQRRFDLHYAITVEVLRQQGLVAIAEDFEQMLSTSMLVHLVST